MLRSRTYHQSFFAPWAIQRRILSRSSMGSDSSSLGIRSPHVPFTHCALSVQWLPSSFLIKKLWFGSPAFTNDIEASVLARTSTMLLWIVAASPEPRKTPFELPTVDPWHALNAHDWL